MMALEANKKNWMQHTWPVVKFVLVGAAAYFSLYYAYEQWYLAHYISLGTVTTDPFTRLYTNHVAGFLSMFGIKTTVIPVLNNFGCSIAVNGVAQVNVIPSCNGAGNLIMMLTLLLAFPGPVSKKMWFIPLALVSFYGCNVLRVGLLTMFHDSTYTQYFKEIKPLANAITHVSLFVIFVLWLKISLRK
jgi:exosortase/archaeosortase family protein